MEELKERASRATYAFGPFQLDPAERRLTRDGQDLRLTPKVFETLVLLVERRGLLVEKDELMKVLWPDMFVEEVTLARNISLLRKALGDAPGQDQSQYIETVSKRGYRFIAEVRQVEPSAVTAAKAPEFKRNRIAWPLAFLCLLLLAGAGVFWRLHRNSGPPLHSLAVLPMENLSSDSEQEYLAEGITDELITNLAQIHSLRVISRTSVMQFKHTKKTLPEIAAVLNVDAIVEGSVSKNGNNVHITAQLIDVRQDSHLWADSYDSDIAEVPSLQRQVAKTIADHVKATLTPEETIRLNNRSPENAVSYDLLLQGQFIRGKMDRDAGRQREALRYFEQAVAIDPKNARAWAWIGHCYASLGGDYEAEDPAITMPKARAAIDKALELDPNLPEAYIASGWLKMFERDDVGAEQDFRRGIELSPNNSEAHRRYAFFLNLRGRFDEAMEEDKRAIDLAPLDIMPRALLTLIYQEKNLPDQEIEQANRVLELDPTYKPAYQRLGDAYAKKGQWSEAISNYDKTKDTDKIGYLLGVTWIYAKSGNKPKAEAAKAELIQYSKHHYVSPCWLARYEARFGDREAAFRWLEKAYQRRDPALNELAEEDDYDRIRSDPRFKDLQRRVELRKGEKK